MQAKRAVLAAAVAAVVNAQNASITDTLAGRPDLSNLTSFITMFPDLVSTLGAATNITVLAPTNEAFSQLLAAGTPSNETVQALLTYHVLNGSYMSSQIMDTPTFTPTLLTNSAYSNVTGGQVVELVLSDNNATVFSGSLMNASVTEADIQFTGGYLHVIDQVLSLPMNTSSTASALGLSAIVGAATQADLVTALDTTPDLTIFVPQNEAFEAIGSALPNLTTEQLTSILQYHVVPGVVGYSSALSNTTLPTLGGSNLTISIIDGSVFVNSAQVVIPNVLVANGVVHVIDNVLNPANATASPNPTASTQAPAFAGASSASDLPFTSNVPTPTTTIATAGATASSGGGSGSGASATASMSQAGAAGPFIPAKTGAVGAAALFGAAAIWNL